MPVYLNEKTKKYFTTFYYVDRDGRRRRKKKEGFATKRKALDFQMDFLSNKAFNCSMKFSVMFNQYAEDYKARRKGTSIATTIPNLSKHCLPVFGEIPISDITPLMIRTWQNGLLTQNYSVNYQKWLSGNLSAVFNFAVKYYGLKANPVAIAGPIGINDPAKKMDFWTKKEFDCFLTTLKSNKKFAADNLISPMYVAFNILFYTGIRMGELLALNFGDYDPQTKTLQINKTLSKFGKELNITTPKTPTSIRTIPLTPKICHILDSYIATMYNPRPSEFLLYPIITKYKLRYALKSIGKAAGLPQIRVHDLRHSHASLLIDLGISPLVISERLGHKNVQTTLDIYSHLYPTRREELVKKLDKIINI